MASALSAGAELLKAEAEAAEAQARARRLAMSALRLGQSFMRMLGAQRALGEQLEAVGARARKLGMAATTFAPIMTKLTTVEARKAGCPEEAVAAFGEVWAHAKTLPGDCFELSKRIQKALAATTAHVAEHGRGDREGQIDKVELMNIMADLDKDGDGEVDKEEFKEPWMKLFPDLSEEDFEGLLLVRRSSSAPPATSRVSVPIRTQTSDTLEL